MSPRRARDLLALLACLALAVLYTGIRSDFGTRFAVGPDPTQDVWVLNWVSRHLISDPVRVFEGNVSFPSHNSVLFCDPLLGPAVLAIPIGLVTANPVIVYNLTVLATLTLAGWGFYRLAHRLTECVAGSLLAAILIVYSPLQTQHLAHLNLMGIAGFPFLLLALLRLFDRPGPAPALAAAFWFAFQAGTSGYHAFSAMFLCLIVAAWRWRFLRLRTAAWAATAAVAALVLLLPYLATFAQLKEAEGWSRGTEAAADYSLDVGRALIRSRSVLWSSALGADPNAAFPGLVLLGLAGLGLLRGDRRWRSLLVAIFVFFFALALGPGLRFQGRTVLWLPSAILYEHVPLFDAVRHPMTFLVPATIGLGLLAALGARALNASGRPLLLSTLSLLAILETLIPPPRRSERPLPVPEVYTHVAGLPRGALLDLPMSDFGTYTWWSTFHGLPIVTGLGAIEPRRHAEIYRLLKKEWEEGPPGTLEGRYSTGWLKTHFPIRYVVVHRAAPAALVEKVQATPEMLEPIHVTTEGDRLYRFHRNGRGDRLRRWFRDDQLRDGDVVADLTGPASGILDVSLNDQPFGRLTLTGERQRPSWTPPRERLLPGMNLVTLQMATPGEVTVFDIETLPEGRSSSP